jgi:histone H3/H4
MRPSAWALDVEVAVEAVHALALIGGEEADDALDRAASDLAPPAIRAAAHQARRTVQSCR